MAPRLLATLGLALIVLGATAAGAGQDPAPRLPRVPAALPGALPFPAALRERLARELAGRGPDYEPRTDQREPDGSPRFTNRLLLEASPYLQQHAHNPVNWYPWGDEAFATAKRLKRPVLVSIGYSTCHWCHVMEEESFDDPATAEVLNAGFIAIKVDREVRPDVDAIYMTALHVTGQSGGWPLNVFLTPDRKPFYGGTYFPPGESESRGRPGFVRVLRTLATQYREDPGAIETASDQVAERLAAALEGEPATATRIPGPRALHRAKAHTARRFDPKEGGVGSRQKFPSSLPVRLLLRYHRRTGDAEALRMATFTLEKMAAGGIHDQVGGGFHRYSVDPRWRVPHFEKMLYDNALLALAYLEGWQATGRADFERVLRGILDYVAREMTAPGGGFYSATDADSLDPEGERVEGWFFTWTPDEIRAALPEDQARLVLAHHGVRGPGPVEGRHVLHVARPLGEIAQTEGADEAELRRQLTVAHERMLAVRATRPPPLRDDKILAAWNGLMISAFARAGFALDEPAWIEDAVRAADFALAQLRREGRLLRVWKAGATAGPAFLEDYAFLIAGLLDLYEAEGSPRWLHEAIALQVRLDHHYADDAGGGYFKTPHDHERLLAREKPANDGALPSGNSVAALNLLRLYHLTGRAEFVGRAALLFSFFYDRLDGGEGGLAELAIALDAHLDTAKEVVIVSRGPGTERDALLAPLRRAFLPNRIQAVLEESAVEAHAGLVPVVGGKLARGGRPTAYVCEDRVCKRPTSDPAVLTRQLDKVHPLEPLAAD